MELIYIDEVDSTHKYLKDYIKANGYKKPLAIITQNQTAGIGSRNNNWEAKVGNLFFSFVVHKSDLPQDLPLQSASIYFSYILKDILKREGSNIWLKWPNDFYCENKKVGGTITTLSNNLVLCGIGLNLIKVNDKFGFLDIAIDIYDILDKYFKALEKFPQWKQIFSKFEIEFSQMYNFKTNIGNKKILLKDTLLQSDGSLIVEGKRVFSLR